MDWKIGEAQQKFSELINAAIEAPQLIYNQNQLVVAVVEANIFQEFLAWRHQCNKQSLANAFIQLHQICEEEDYILEIPPRQDQPFRS
jgi:hypothetical protein